jgi:hypothetical protein
MKKIVFGILASTNEHYSKFIEIWIENIKKFKSGTSSSLIDFYFIYAEPRASDFSMSPEYDVCNPEQPMYYNYYSKYNENDSMMDSFVNRTVCLLDHLHKHPLVSTPFDYFIRTNLSTLFHLDILIQGIQKLPKYNLIAGSPIDKLNSIHTQISGTNILLSRDLVDFLLLNKDCLLDESILHGDDQRISSLIIENLNVNLLLIKRLDFIEMNYDGDKYIPPSIIFQNCYGINNLFCYRFKTTNRENDIKYMKMLQQHMYLENFNPLQFVMSLVDNPDAPYEKTLSQNTDYDKLTHTIFQIKNNAYIMETYHHYKNVSFKYTPSNLLKKG